jgi:hypothetical protein
MSASLRLVCVLVLACAVAPSSARGGPETAPTAGLRRTIEVGTLSAVTPRGSADRAVFAEVKIGGEVGFEVDQK